MPSKIKKRGNSYLFTVSGGYQNGQQITYTKTVKGIRPGDVNKEYKLFELECLSGKVLPSSTPKMTLSQFFTYWQDNYAKPNLAPTTVKYNEFIADRILGALGHLAIHKITPQHCLQLLEQLRQPNIGANGKPLSDTTIRKHYTLLNELMNFAYKWDFISANPLTKIDPPKKNSDKKELPEKQAVTEFLSLVTKHADIKFKLWTMLAFSMGLRREEIFGLQMNDIDFESNTLSVNRAAVYVHGEGVISKSTKTKGSKRILAMPAVISKLLKEYIKTAKPAVTNLSERWLFCRQDGTVANPEAFNDFLKRFQRTHGQFGITPHVLRHMYGSYLIRSGVDLALTSQQLGHSNKSFTADTYIHVTERVETRAAEVMQNIVDGLIK